MHRNRPRGFPARARARSLFASVATLAALSAQPARGEPVSIAFVPGGLFSTGFSVTGQLQTSGGVDAHYTVVRLPDGCAGVTCQETADPFDLFGPAAYVVAGPNGSFPLVPGTWALGNDANSQWIGPRADQTNPVSGGGSFPSVEVFASESSPYVYRHIFNVSALGLAPETTEILLAWASDDTVASFGTSQIRLCPIESVSSPTCPEESIVAGPSNGPGALELTPVLLRHGSNGAFFADGLMALDFVVYNAPAASGAPNPSGLRVDIVLAVASVPEPDGLALAAAAVGALGALRGRRAGRGRSPGS